MSFSTNAQDAAVSAHLSPSNGCDLTASEDVNVIILNNGSAPIFSGTLTVKYQVNGGVVQSQNLSTNIPGGGGNTWNCMFTSKANLSGCDTDYTVKVWLEYATDTDSSNDTLTWVVRNDCTIAPGQVLSDATVCSGSNNNTLNLNGWSHGTITSWIYSEDNGATWIPTSNTTISETYSNLTNTRWYKVAIEGGYCLDDSSNYAVITAQPVPIVGTLSTSNDSLCITNANGMIALSGNSTSIMDWESSTDNGSTWSNSGNTTNTELFTGLTQTTLFRAKIDGGVCPDAYSDTLEIFIQQASVAGVLSKDSTICKGSDVDLSLGTSTATDYVWESSLDGTNWIPVNPNNNAMTYNTGTLTASTYFHTIAINGICPGMTSNDILISVNDSVVPGVLSGGTSVCAANASGALSLTGNSGNILQWESSIDEGNTWVSILNTSTTQNYNGVTQTTIYRVLVDGGACPDGYSTIDSVTVSPITNAGTLSGTATVCIGADATIQLGSNIGGVVKWQYSTDGVTWIDISSTDSTQIFTSVTQPYYYHAIVKSGVCDNDTTTSFFIDTLSLPIANAGIDTTIHKGDSVLLSGSGGAFGIWSPGASLSDSTIYTPLATPQQTITYTLFVVGLNGCYGKDGVVITVGNPIPPINAKNVITPNGDGFNDVWHIEGEEIYPYIEVYVYNIYGQEIYSNKDYKNDWGGEYKGKPLPDGTYLYVVKLGGNDSVLKGNLTILGNE